MDKNAKYSRLLDEQIASIQKENRHIEFKSNYQDPDKLGQYISALSNGACLDGKDFGYLYFGVQDKTLEITGTSFDPSKEKAKGNQSLELYLRVMISPKINFSIEDFTYQKNGNPLFVNLLNNIQHVVYDNRREPQRGFIQHKEARILHDSTCNRTHLLLAAGHGTSQLTSAFINLRKQIKAAFQIFFTVSARFF